MTDTTRAPEAAFGHDDPEAAVGTGQSAGQRAGAGTGPSASAGPLASEAAPHPAEALAREVADLKDRLLRTLAEMENLRRRTEREVADTRVYAVTAFARDVLGVADNMQRALDTVAPDLRANAGPGVTALLDGVELTERELLKVLEKHGIRKFAPQGEKFDPNLHQAMFQVPDPNAPAGTVVQVVQPGYMIGERILRPAMVGISAGGPKAPQDVNGSMAGNDNLR